MAPPHGSSGGSSTGPRAPFGRTDDIAGAGLGRRSEAPAPQIGSYVIQPKTSDGASMAPSWLLPGGEDQLETSTLTASLGRGPAQFVGVYDTMPHLEPYDDAVHKLLKPRDMPGGAVLRWLFPRATELTGQSPDTSVISAQRRAFLPTPSGSNALIAWVAGFDVLPRTWNQWHTDEIGTDGVWPGIPPHGGENNGYLADGASNRHNIAADLASTRPHVPGQGKAGTTRPLRDFGAGGGNKDALYYLATAVARPMLDLFGYMGGGAEADLLELAGGTRYVAVWLQFMWSRWDGTDLLGSSLGTHYEIPWTVTPGRAIAAGHREAWHTSIPLDGPSLTVPITAATLYNFGAGFTACSPIAGAVRATIVGNGQSAEPGSIFAMLRGYNGAAGPYDQATIAPDAQDTLELPHNHCGTISLFYGYDEAVCTRPIAALASLSVTR